MHSPAGMFITIDYKKIRTSKISINPSLLSVYQIGDFFCFILMIVMIKLTSVSVSETVDTTIELFTLLAWREPWIVFFYRQKKLEEKSKTSSEIG